MSQIATPAVTTLSPSLAQRMALIIAGLCQAVAARGAKDRAMATILIWRRLRRMAARFDALVARVRAGAKRGRRFVPIRLPRHRILGHPILRRPARYRRARRRSGRRIACLRVSPG